MKYTTAPMAPTATIAITMIIHTGKPSPSLPESVFIVTVTGADTSATVAFASGWLSESLEAATTASISVFKVFVNVASS